MLMYPFLDFLSLAKEVDFQQVYWNFSKLISSLKLYCFLIVTNALFFTTTQEISGIQLSWSLEIHCRVDTREEGVGG